MKKFLSMFAFAAAIVLGAFTLASCGDDDDIIPEQPKHQFSLTAELTSDNPAIANDPDFKDAAEYVNTQIAKTYSGEKMYGTTLQGAIFWDKFITSDLWKGFVNSVIKVAKLNNDPTMKVHLKMWKDGKEVFKEKEYKPLYIDFL